MRATIVPILRRRAPSLILAALTAGLGACSENLDTAAACPSLCPGQVVVLRDTVLQAITVDSSIVGFPVIGQETLLLISTRGDTLDTRGVIRFDSLPTRFFRRNVPTDSALAGVDRASILLRVDTTGVRPGAPVTITLFDVDTTAGDTVTAALLPLFRPSRLLGSHTFAPESLVDTIRISVAHGPVLAKITSQGRLRVGIQATGTNRAQIRVGTSNGFFPASITFKPAAHGDTAGVTALTVSPNSATPAGSPIRTDLVDYVFVPKGPRPGSNQILAVGGMPASRVYLRFDLPPAIVDSSTVVRASLLLTQVANPLSPDAHDSSNVYPVVVLASEVITDVARALHLIAQPGTLGLDTLPRFTPADSGLPQI